MEAYGETSDGTLLCDCVADVADNLFGQLMFSPAHLRKSVYHSLNTNDTSDSELKQLVGDMTACAPHSGF